MMTQVSQIKKMGLLQSFGIYIAASILMFIITKDLIPYLSEATGQETILFWFVAGGLGIFLPLVILGIFILRTEGVKLNKETFTGRLRFRKLSRHDLLWILLGFALVAILSLLVMKILSFIYGEFEHSPAFMIFEPLSAGRYWLQLIWAPYWVLNILGEEFLWRGVMFPRQEQAFGKYTWIIHGAGWGLFHLAFGLKLLLMLLPLIFIQSWVVQKTKNSWSGVIMHGGINGPAFIAIAFGVM